jgi:excisionase family DNA binding protein
MDSRGLIIFMKSIRGVVMEDLRKYLTVPEVAKRLDITEEWVRDLIARKEIKAVKVGQWKIKPEDLEDFIKNRRNY